MGGKGKHVVAVNSPVPRQLVQGVSQHRGSRRPGSRRRGPGHWRGPAAPRGSPPRRAAHAAGSPRPRAGRWRKRWQVTSEVPVVEPGQLLRSWNVPDGNGPGSQPARERRPGPEADSGGGLAKNSHSCSSRVPEVSRPSVRLCWWWPMRSSNECGLHARPQLPPAGQVPGRRARRRATAASCGWRGADRRRRPRS